MARNLPPGEERSALLKMAEEWDRFAEQREHQTPPAGIADGNVRKMRGSAVASDTHRINRPHENVGLSNHIKGEGSHWRWQIFWNSTVILQGVAATRAEAVASARGLQLFIRGAPRLADQQEHVTDLRRARGKWDNQCE